MSEQLSNQQIIVSTHSPAIVADYEDYLMEIKLNPTDPSKRDNQDGDDDLDNEDDSLDYGEYKGNGDYEDERLEGYINYFR